MKLCCGKNKYIYSFLIDFNLFGSFHIVRATRLVNCVGVSQKRVPAGHTYHFWPCSFDPMPHWLRTIALAFSSSVTLVSSRPLVDKIVI